MYYTKTKPLYFFETIEDARDFFTDEEGNVPSDLDLAYIEALPAQTGSYGGYFTLDENAGLVWIENPPPLPEPPKKLTDVELLQAQNKALSDRADFLEDCIAEMAVQVYGGV